LARNARHGRGGAYACEEWGHMRPVSDGRDLRHMHPGFAIR
jgi:hypothetical protein